MPMHAKQSGRSFAQGVMLVVTRLASLASLPCLMMAVASAPVSAADGQPEITHGLIHYWSFDRTDDDGRRDNAGDIPLRNSYRKTGEWLVDGAAGEAADIGKTQNLDGLERDLAPRALSVAGWIRYEPAANESKSRAILSAGNHSDPAKKPWVFQLHDRRLALFGGAKSVKTTEAVPEGRWVHVAATVADANDASDPTARTARLYIDGREVASGAVGIVPQTALVLVGNTHRSGPDGLGGQIDELAVWDRPLAATEIAALHRHGGEGKSLRSLVTTRPTVSITAQKASSTGGGTFVLGRDSGAGTLRVHLGWSGLAIPGTDYAPLPTIQTFPDGVREIRIPVSRLEGVAAVSRDDLKATIEPGILYTVSEAAPAARVWLTPDWPAAAPERPKKIFAHYMACYPVAAGATAHHREADAHKVRHDGKGQFDRGGDRWRNWPLVPDGMRVSLQESADLEIRRALRGGIDGFAIDAWAGGDNAKKMFSALLEVARDKDYPFEITVCLDPATLSNEAIQDALRWIMQEHGQNPKLARRDGKPLVFGYMSSFIGFHHGAAALKQMPEFADQDLKELIKNRDLRTTKAGWKRMAEGHREIEKAAGTPLYFHYCMEAFFHPGGLGPVTDEDTLRAAAFMAGEFGAVGQFKAGGPLADRMAEVVRAAGAEWAQPMYYQYENLFWGGNSIPKGSSILRGCWEAARRNQSTLIQFVTWNDYTENTQLAPAYETRYAILDLNRYFVDWWKTGQEPRPERDKIYLFFRKYPVDAKIFPFQPIQPETDGVIEVLTILTQPGRMRLAGRGEEWDAPAGMSWKHFPVTPGPVSAELLRGGKVALRLDSPEPITDHPFRQINSLCAISTECLRHWREDFGDASPEPLLRGLEADDDSDGLPNWFEMYWFGKFMDWTTATVADPKAIGAGGKTMLEHYQAQTDPTLAKETTNNAN